MGKTVLGASLIGLLALASLGCGHYRSSIGDYRGPGSVTTASHWQGGYSHRFGDFALAWPVEKVDISQPYRPPRNKRHQGIDLRGPRGTPIYAAHSGRVIYAGQGFRGYGKLVMIEHGPVWASLYAHLNSIDVSEGDYVRIGEPIGRMGRTGRATGVHLHFELMKNKLPVDPLLYLPQLDSSRLAGR